MKRLIALVSALAVVLSSAGMTSLAAGAGANEQDTGQETYAAELQDTEHGSIEFADPDGEEGTPVSFQPGEEVKVKVKPDDGYVSSLVIVRDGSDHSILLSEEPEDGGYAFEMPESDVSVSAIFRSADGSVPEEYKERVQKDRELVGDYTPQESESGSSGSESSGTVKRAARAAARASSTGNLVVGKTIYYDNYDTNDFAVDGNSALCADPTKNTPLGGNYTKIYDFKNYLPSKSDDQVEYVRRVMYYCYGAPGFDAGMWPSRWYDGSAMNAERYIALGHILMSDIYSYSGLYAMYGCSSGFIDWASYNVTGYNVYNGSEINTNSTRHQALRKGAPSTFKVFILDTGSTTQNIISWEYTPEGKMKLQKYSLQTDITSGNSCYSLEGAEYSIWKNQACTEGTGVGFRTDANGVGYAYGNQSGTDYVTLPAGTYYVKETKAPKGYGLNDTVYPVTVTSGQTTYAGYDGKVYDTPQTDPLTILLKKADAETGKSSPQGSATLQGAKFTVKFYQGTTTTTDPAASGKKASRSWVFETDKDGYCEYASKYLISGDALYYDYWGTPSLPIGTVTIQETTAPEGYLRNSTVYVIPVKGNGTGDHVYTYNVPTVPENTLDLDIVKKEKGTDKVIPGVVFRHTLPDGSTEQVTTDKNGKASFKGLTWGTHTVQEVSVPDGYTVNPGKVTFKVEQGNKITVTSNTSKDATGSMKFTVQKDGSALLEAEDILAPYELLLYKQNEFGKSLEGAEFRLYSDKDCKKEISKETTKSDGTLSFQNLTVGTKYYLKETKAPEGYRLPVNAEGNDVVYEIRTESDPSAGTFAYYVNGEKYTSSKGNYTVTGTKAKRVVTLLVPNFTGVQMPETGSHARLALSLVGLACMAGAAAAYIYIRKRKNGEKGNEKE